MMKIYNGRVPACGVFCGGCPTYTRQKNPCLGAQLNSARCEKCKTFHLCCLEKRITGFAYEFFDLIIRYVLIEINADPIFLIHVPAWFYTGIFSLQFSRFVRVTFDATKIENLNVNETKPFVRNIKA